MRSLRFLASLVVLTGTVACASGGSTAMPTFATTPPPPPVPAVAVASPLMFTKFLAFGDSLTEGLATPVPSLDRAAFLEVPYPAKLQSLLNAMHPGQQFVVFNEGVGGERAAQAQARLAAAIDRLEPDVVLLMEGTNDINDMKDDADDLPRAVAEIGKLIATARSHGSRVVLSTLPPQRPGSPRAYSPQLVAPFNAQLAALARSQGTPLVDVYANITLDLLAPDGLHLTASGNQRLAEIFSEALQRFFSATYHH